MDVFLKALTEESADLYTEHCFRGTTVKDFRRTLLEKQAAKSPPESVAAEPVNKRDWEEANASPTTMFHPGLNLVPHKVVLLDRAKALRNDPSLKMECFLSLVDDGIALPDIRELKVILVVGETGSGKSTFINSLVNFLYLVQYSDPYRLKLISEPPTVDRKAESSSQTDQVVGYLLEAPPALGGHSLLIIDTPGFGDTRGAARDMQTITELKHFLESEVSYLNSVCFVVNGTSTRLTPTKRWIFDQILCLFGKDIKGIISILMTFSDANVPPALAVVNDAKLEYEHVFKLNNSGFFCTRDDAVEEEIAFNELFFRLGYAALSSFLRFACDSGPRGLQTTKKVLDRRQQLQNSIENIRKYVNFGMTKLNELELTINRVVRVKSLIDANRNFTIHETRIRRVQRPKTSLYNTVCSTCQWTCHESCIYGNDNQKMNCCAMSHGFCKVCPQKCHWNLHQNLDYFWDTEEYQIEVTNDELKARYVSATSEESEFEQIMEGLSKEFRETQDEVVKLVMDVKSMIAELQRIALKPGTYHEDQYFDQIVEVEKKEAKRGWQDRVKMIESLKERSRFLIELDRGEYDPFNERRKELERQAMEGKVRCKVGPRRSLLSRMWG